MRIGFDLTAALTQGGGIGRYTRELVRAVVDANSAHQFRFFSAKPPAQLPVPDAVPTGPHAHYRPAPLSERWLYRIWYRLRLPLPVQAFTGGIDLFHSPDFVLPPVWGRTPTLVTVHDLSFVHYPHTFPERLVAYLNQVVPWSVQRATHVLADSVATQQDLVTLWQVPPEKVSVLYCGVDARFRPATAAEKTAVRARYGLGERPYLLSVGTVQPRKNYDLLLQAFAQISPHIPHNFYIVGGKGWLYDDLLASVDRLGLTDRVQFLGFIDDQDLPALYGAASLFLFASLYEGFGIPLLEAMACGAPVISSNASSLPEVTGEAAVLLPPRDPDAWAAGIRALLNDPTALAERRQAGLQQAQTFTWSQAAQQLMALYDRLLSR